MSDIVRIPFHGEEILTVDVDGQPHIVLKPVIEGLGLDYWSQVEKLRKRSWAATSNRQVQVSDQAQRREMLTCDVRTFLMLLATVDETRVSKDEAARDTTHSYLDDVDVQALWDEALAPPDEDGAVSVGRQELINVLCELELLQHRLSMREGGES